MRATATLVTVFVAVLAVGCFEEGDTLSSYAPTGELYKVTGVRTSMTCDPSQIGTPSGPFYWTFEVQGDLLVQEHENGNLDHLEWDQDKCRGSMTEYPSVTDMACTATETYYFSSDGSLEGNLTLNCTAPGFYCITITNYTGEEFGS